MPTPEEYLEAAHTMSRGRTHRITRPSAVFEEFSEDWDTVGAWVPIEVWITAEEVAALQRLATAQAEMREYYDAEKD